MSGTICFAIANDNITLTLSPPAVVLAESRQGARQEKCRRKGTNYRGKMVRRGHNRRTADIARGPRFAVCTGIGGVSDRERGKASD